MLADYGKLHVSSADYTVLRPDSVDAATRRRRGGVPLWPKAAPCLSAFSRNAARTHEVPVLP